MIARCTMKISRALLSKRANPRHTALLVIDMQNDFVHEKGAFTGFGFDTSKVRESVSDIRKVLEAAREAGMLIIHTRMINNVNQNPPSWQAFWGKPTVTIEGTWGAEFYKDLKPKIGEIVLTKFTYGAFYSTNLETILKNRGIVTIVAVGTGPNICLGDTVHQAFALGYHVIVPKEAVAVFSKIDRDFTDKVKDVSLYIIKNHYGIVCSVDDILAVWSAAKA